MALLYVYGKNGFKCILRFDNMVYARKYIMFLFRTTDTVKIELYSVTGKKFHFIGKMKRRK